MNQRISTAYDSGLCAKHAGVPAGVGTSCPAGRMRSGTRPPKVAHPEALRDALTGGTPAETRTVMSAAHMPEAERWPLPPFDEAGHGTSLDPVTAILTVLRVAAQIEPDPVEVGIWYRRIRIAELGGLTARQLVSLGRAGEVVGFLLSIRNGRRD